MNRFKRFLVYVDPAPPTHPAIDVAAPWARRNNASVRLLHCVPEPPWLSRLLWSGADDAYGAALAAATARLEQLAEPLRADGTPTSVAVVRGRIALETTREVLRGDHDLVVKAAAPDEGLRGALLGTDDMRLLRKCPCPVWLVEPEPRAANPGRILAAIDPEPGGKAKSPLATKILELASSLAAEVGAELHIGHAWSLYGESLLRGRAGMDDDAVARLVRGARAAAERAVTGIVTDFGAALAQARVHLVKGDPWLTIPALVEHEAIDLLVMGTIARTGVPGFVMGNTAERILGRLSCAVLTVKPEGFVSPVTLDEAGG